MSTCTIRFLYNAENREFSLTEVSPTQTVLSVKQQAVEKWPTDLNNKPPDASHVRLLFAGKFLEDDKVLQDLNHFSASETTTFHLIVMPPPAENKAAGTSSTNEKVGAGATSGDTAARAGTSAVRCQCVIS